MTSDEDASLSSEILYDFRSRVNSEAGDSAGRQTVAAAVDLYIRCRNFAKQKRAERDILHPLGLTGETFISVQKEMSADFITAVGQQIIDYRMPKTSSIVCGVDVSGSHIYVINDGDSGCFDDIGFASVGAGANHANSQFMLNEYTPQATAADAIFLTYLAKRRAEVAPGVGFWSDTIQISPLGVASSWHRDLWSKIEKEYYKLTGGEHTARAKAKRAIRSYANSLNRAPEAWPHGEFKTVPTAHRVAAKIESN
jgi:hypothetical protein